MLYKLDRTGELEVKVDALNADVNEFAAYLGEEFAKFDVLHSDADAGIYNLNVRVNDIQANLNALAGAVGTDVGLLGQAGALLCRAVRNVEQDIEQLEDAAIGDFQAIMEEVSAIKAKLNRDVVNKARGAAYIAKRQAEQDGRLDALEARVEDNLKLADAQHSGTAAAYDYTQNRVSDTNRRLDALEADMFRRLRLIVDGIASNNVVIEDMVAHVNAFIRQTNDKFGIAADEFESVRTDMNDNFGLVAQAFQDTQADNNRRFRIIGDWADSLIRSLQAIRLPFVR